jgi:hypothetical protein
LLPGEKAVISTPFRVKFPSLYGRIGHQEQTYKAAYWYPFPAVYDRNGWHPMSLLKQGEGYFEFGDYEVSITLPENYRVGATGVLQNEEEREWLDRLAHKTAKRKGFPDTSKTPSSAKETKTLHYEAENVLDFAWFTSKRYHVLKDSVELPDHERTVTTWSFFTNEVADHWKNSIEYINEGVYDYSKWVGEYPYPQVTAVYAPFQAGGMEFPMVTEVSSHGTEESLGETIVHELGHNWFYGILASNARKYTWMDEGMNTFYQMRYRMTELREEGIYDGELPKKEPESSPPQLFETEDGSLSLAIGSALGGRSRRGIRNIYKFKQHVHSAQKPSLHSTDFTSQNYFLTNYAITPYYLGYLEAYLGQEHFDDLMQTYYEKWKFGHPGPEDFGAVLKKADKPVDWFLEGFIQEGEPIDLAIGRVEEKEDHYSIRVKNKGETPAPFSIGAIKDSMVVDTVWYDGFEGKKSVRFPKGDYDALTIDPFFFIPEYRKKNNRYSLKGPFPRTEALHLDFGMSFGYHRRTELSFLPAIGWNNYDKTMVGAAFYNGLILPQNFEYFFLPMYGFGSKKLTGTGRIAYNWYWDDCDVIERLRFQLGGQSFTEGYHRMAADKGIEMSPSTFVKFAPELSFHFEKPDPNSSIHQSLRLRSVNIFRKLDAQEDVLSLEDDLLTPSGNDYRINELVYRFRNERTLHPYRFKLSLQKGKGLLKARGELNYRINYDLAGELRALELRLFAGNLFQHDAGYPDLRLRMNGFNGRNDYTYDHIFLDRRGTDPVFGRQIAQEEGGFKTASEIGVTDRWLTSLSAKTEVPDLPVVDPYIFAEAGTNPEMIRYSGVSPIAYNAGVSFALPPFIGGDPLLEVYCPLVRSESAGKELYEGGSSYFDKLTFRLRLRIFNFIDRVRDRGLSFQ